MTYSLKLEEWTDGGWAPYVTADAQMAFVMLDPYYRSDHHKLSPLLPPSHTSALVGGLDFEENVANPPSSANTARSRRTLSQREGKARGLAWPWGGAQCVLRRVEMRAGGLSGTGWHWLALVAHRLTLPHEADGRYSLTFQLPDVYGVFQVRCRSPLIA